MTIPAALSVAAAALGLAFALLSWRMSRAPGWQEMRLFAIVSLTAGLYSLFDVPTSVNAPDHVVTWSGRIGMAIAAFHGPSWLLYRAAQERRPPYRWERLLLYLACALAAGALMPGVIMSDQVLHHDVAWLGVTYADAVPTPLGAVAYGAYCLTLLLPLTTYIRSALRRAPAARAHATGLGLLAIAAANDAAVGAGLLNTPYLLAIGFLSAVGFAGGAMVARFVNQARRLDTISRELEDEVDRRTRELADTQLALLQSEKLAALGRLAAGVAHEINNPASVVLANLAYLQLHLAEHDGKPPPDALECIGESSQAVRRIARIVRQLVDAGRAGRELAVERRPFAVRAALEAAAASARLELSPTLSVEISCEAEVHALGDASLLEQVVVNLVINAAHAMSAAGEEGTISISAAAASDQVVVEVRDEGPGIAPEILDHVFEPFFTTKRMGKGTGLGLPVSLGLMRAQGGDLLVASTGPGGTTMRAVLALGNAADTTLPSRPPPPAVRALRMLLIDDDAAVREALRRQLQPYFAVTGVEGVDAALRNLRSNPEAFDVVLCDMMMPDGGGERFDRELGALSASLADRTIYFTGGLTGDAARRFFATLGHRGLHKPIDPIAVAELAQRLCSGRRTRSDAVADSRHDVPDRAAS